MKKIVILLASVGKNLELAEKLENILKGLNAETKLVNLVELDLPLYSALTDKKETCPKAVTSLTASLVESDGIVIVAPEYNGGVPPVLNNAIAWVSRSGGEDWRVAFNGKPAVIATHSGGGGLHALAAMRQQLAYLGTNVMGRQLHTHYQKPLDLNSAEETLKQLL